MKQETYYSKNFVNETGDFDYVKSPLKAIRAKCLYDCCVGSTDEVKNCTCTHCFLYPFRLGKNPFRTPRVMSEERLKQLEEMRKKKSSLK